MNLGSLVVSLLKGKAIAVIGIGVVLAGGATAVMAATPTGQHLIQTISHDSSTGQSHQDDSSHQHGTSSSSHKGDNDDSSHKTASDNDKTCPGLDEIQRLAQKFSLNTDTISDTIKAICALRKNTFKGTTPNGIAVLSNRVLGDGEIEQLLKYAQYLASHDKTNVTGKLTSDNVRTYLAAALHNCGTTSLTVCLKQDILSSLPDNTGNGTKDSIIGLNGDTNPNSNSGDGHSFGNKNSGGKPTTMPPVHS